MTDTRGPWAISVEQAAERDAASARYVSGIINRCLDPDMPVDTIVFKLALRGIGTCEWRRISQQLWQSVLEPAR
jgi:hypothetical protein